MGSSRQGNPCAGLGRVYFAGFRGLDPGGLGFAETLLSMNRRPRQLEIG